MIWLHLFLLVPIVFSLGLAFGAMLAATSRTPTGQFTDEEVEQIRAELAHARNIANTIRTLTARRWH